MLVDQGLLGFELLRFYSRWLVLLQLVWRIAIKLVIRELDLSWIGPSA